MLRQSPSSPALMIVTDRRVATGRAMLDRLASMLEVVAAGTAIVQIREKDLDGAALLALAREVVGVARPHGAAVLINDRLDVALAAGADGVHLPESGLAIAEARRVAAACGRSIVVGCSRHSAPGAGEAAAAGADLIVLGPIWATPSKASFGAPLGLEALTAARAAVGTVAVIAIGGVETAARAAAARQAGATGVAAIRALWGADDPAAAARALAGA
jgi:thiamine-phosphate pyrophosphorylase